MKISVFNVLVKSDSISNIEVRADDTSINDINNAVEFWIEDMRVAYFKLEDIYGFYQIKEEIVNE